MDVESVVRLRRVIGMLARHLNSGATDEGLTPSQASVLAQIVAHGPIGVGRLSQLEGLNPTMLSRVIGKLDEAGLVARHQHPDDLRVAMVQSTASGRRLSERIRQRRTATLSAYVARLPADQAAAITNALPALENLVLELQSRDAGGG